MSLRLIIEDDEGATTIVPLGKDAITIGRQQGNTIQLTEKNVSRRHARLFPDSDAWVIEDLNSYNGIKVNDKAVEGRTSLREGDIVQIGDYHLAITEDVDKSTLNFAGRGAANDGAAAAAADPLMASSSADLPRLSADELHALQSGPQQITPPPQPALIDSGPVPASYATAPTYADDQKKGAGVLIGFGVVVVLALGGAVAWLMSDGGAGGDKAAAAEGKEAKAAPEQPPMPPEPEVLDDGMPEEPPPPVIDDEPDGGDDGGDDVAIVDDGAIDDGGEEIEVPPEPPDPIEPATNPTKKRTPKKSSKPRNNNTGSKPPPPPPEPAGPTAEELLDEAKKLQFKSPSEAYRKAKQSYDKKRNPSALSVMASSACRMGDPAKAKAAHAKLKGSLKADAEKVCAGKGITL